MWETTKRFDKIIWNIMMQDHEIRNLGVEPNRVILGERVFDILHRDFNSMIDFSLEKYKGSDGMNASVCGMPITVDHDNKWIIEVCYGFEWDGKEIVYQDKIC